MEPEEIDAAVNGVEAIVDDEEQMIAAHQSIRAMLRAIVRLSDIRRDAARRLRANRPGEYTYRIIAEKLELDGKSPIQDAQHIVRGRRAPREDRGDA